MSKAYLFVEKTINAANEVETLAEEIIEVLTTGALWDYKIANTITRVIGLSLFQELYKEAADMISIPNAFTLGDIFTLWQSDDTQLVTFINRDTVTLHNLAS